MVAPATYRASALLVSALLVAASLASAREARAQSADDPPLGPRVIHVPTAWVQKSGAVYTSAGVDRLGGAFGALTLGLGGLAEAELVVGDRAIESGAIFRLGVGNGVLWRGPPALTVGFRRSFQSGAIAGERLARAELYLVGSHSFGTLDVHGGARLHSARAEPEVGAARELLALGAFAAGQWRPARYPRTMLMADFSFAPEFQPSGIDLRWLIGWGVRYQALSFGSIELGARHRQGEGFEDAAVLVRVNGAFDLL